METILELLLSALAGMLVISMVWMALLQQHRTRNRMLTAQLAMAFRELDEHEHRAEELLALAHHHLPLGRRPELVREALPALDRAMVECQGELKQLHRRLVVNLHVINQLRKSEEQLSARVLELEQILMESSEYELRARFRAVASERDYFRNQLVELQQLVSPEQSGVPEQMVTLNRQNEVLRSELKQARRLIHVMQRQIRLLERQSLEGAGLAMKGLQQQDLPPGAFESLSDVTLDDPEEFAGPDRTPLPIPTGPRAALLVGSAADKVRELPYFPQPIAPGAAACEDEDLS